MLTDKYDAKGWSVLPPADPARTTTVYADSRDGNDAGKGTPNDPVKSLARVAALRRPGTALRAYLAKGAVFPEPLPVGRGGPSRDNPDVWTSWGQTGLRPVVSPFKRDACTAMSTTNVAFIDLAFRAARRRPGDAGFDDWTSQKAGDGLVLWAVRDVLVEDCTFELWKNGLICQAPDGAWSKGVSVRRCLFRDCYWSGAMHSEGLYVHNTDGLLLDENIHMHCGWLGDGRKYQDTVFNHNAYITGACRNVAVLGMITTDAASHGLQLRCGGVLQDYLAIDCPVGLSYGLVNGGGPYAKGGVVDTIDAAAGVTPASGVRRIVVVGGRDLTEPGGKRAKRGIGIQTGNLRRVDFRSILVTEDRQDSGISWAFTFEYDDGAVFRKDSVGVQLAAVNGLVVDRWKRGLYVKPGFSSGQGTNSWRRWGTVGVHRYRLPAVNSMPGGAVSEDTPLPPGGGPRLADYLNTIGLTEATYREQLTQQRHTYWRPELTARSVNAWLLGRHGLEPAVA